MHSGADPQPHGAAHRARLQEGARSGPRTCGATRTKRAFGAQRREPAALRRGARAPRALRRCHRPVPPGAHRPLRARSEPHARARAGAVRQGRRRRRAQHAGRSHPPEPGLPLARGPPALRARARGGRQRGQGAGGVPASWPRPIPAPRPPCATRSCCRRRAGARKRRKSRRNCWSRRASPPRTTAAPSESGSRPLQTPGVAPRARSGRGKERQHQRGRVERPRRRHRRCCCHWEYWAAAPRHRTPHHWRQAGAAPAQWRAPMRSRGSR